MEVSRLLTSKLFEVSRRIRDISENASLTDFGNEKDYSFLNDFGNEEDYPLSDSLKIKNKIKTFYERTGKTLDKETEESL